MALMKIGGLELNVRQWGEGEPIVLVHGLGTSSDLWIHQLRPFAARYHVVALDLRGFGRSAKPADRAQYTIDAMTDDVIGVCRALGLTSVHYLGVSMGGFIGQALALKAPALCRTLILAVTAGDFAIPQDVVEARMAALREMPMDDYAALVASQALAQPADPFVLEWLREMIARNDRTAYEHVFAGALAGFDLAQQVGEIRCPTLVVTASDDRVIPPAHGRALRERIKGAEHAMIEDAGHIAYAEQPAEFNRVVLDFLARH